MKKEKQIDASVLRVYSKFEKLSLGNK